MARALEKKARGEMLALRIAGGHYLCRVCKLRHAQGGCDGRCLRCTREHWESVDPIPQYRIPADRLQPRPPIRTVIQGVEYEIVWNGQ